MQSETDILSAAGITVRRWQGNNARTTCPECSAHRKKKTDPCLSVTRKPDGLVWTCWHCGQSGGGFFDDTRRHEVAARGSQAGRRAAFAYGREGAGRAGARSGGGVSVSQGRQALCREVSRGRA